jgi:hypothetical protein
LLKQNKIATSNRNRLSGEVEKKTRKSLLDERFWFCHGVYFFVVPVKSSGLTPVSSSPPRAEPQSPLAPSLASGGSAHFATSSTASTSAAGVLHTVDLRKMVLPIYDDTSGHDLLRRTAAGKQASITLLDWRSGLFLFCLRCRQLLYPAAIDDWAKLRAEVVNTEARFINFVQSVPSDDAVRDAVFVFTSILNKKMVLCCCFWQWFDASSNTKRGEPGDDLSAAGSFGLSLSLISFRFISHITRALLLRTSSTAADEIASGGARATAAVRVREHVDEAVLDAESRAVDRFGRRAELRLRRRQRVEADDACERRRSVAGRVVDGRRSERDDDHDRSSASRRRRWRRRQWRQWRRWRRRR